MNLSEIERSNKISVILIHEGLIIKSDDVMAKKEGEKERREELEKLSDNDLIEKFEEVKKEVSLEQEEAQYVLDEKDLLPEIHHAMGLFEGKRYYGVTLKRKIRYDDGFKIKEIPAIITEEGEILDETKEKFTFHTVMNIKNRWSNQGIKEYRRKNKVTLKKAYEEILKEYKKHLVYEEDEWYVTDTLWDIATYFQDLLDKYLFLKHEGPSGSAKSKGMKLSSNVAFNGRKWTAPTPANFFRYRHFNKATIYIEEAERLFDSKGQNNDLIVEYLNASYEKGNFVPRQNDKDLNKTEEFDPSGFTRIGAINPLKGALEKRSLTKTMVKAPKGDKRGETEVPSQEYYQPIRDLLYNACLNQYKEVKKTLETIENNYSVTNREWNLIKPLLAIYHVIEPSETKKFGEWLSNKFTQRDDTYDEESWETKLIQAFFYLTAHGEDFVSNKELVNRYCVERGDPDNENRISSKAVTSISKKIGFGRFMGRNSSGSERGYRLTFEKVFDLVLRNGYFTKKDIEEYVKKNVSDLSKCQIVNNIINRSPENTDNSSDSSFSNNNHSSDSSFSSDKLTDRTDILEGNEEIIRDLSVNEWLKENNNFHENDFLTMYSPEELEGLKNNGTIAEQRKGWYQCM